MGVTSCATLPFLPGTHVFSTVFKLLQANSTLFKHLWLVTPGNPLTHIRKGDRIFLFEKKNVLFSRSRFFSRKEG